MRKIASSLIICMLGVQIGSAEIIGVAGGTVAPQPELGAYTMTPFPLDERPVFELVTSVPSPLGGDLLFSSPTFHFRVGEGWGGWTHLYTGDVYTTVGLTELELTLPPDTYAFYLYVAHDHGAIYTMTAQADGGPSVTQSIQTYGASYFGFYQDDISKGPLETITVSASIPFAIGEFGIAVPEPSCVALLLTGALALVRRRH